MRKGMRLMAIGGMLGLGLAANAHAVVIIDNTTQGYYNDSIGTLLNGTDPLFPVAPADPTISPIPIAPNLGAASAELGGWLGNPPVLNANWSGPEAIPSTWAIHSETAIIYTISGFYNVTATFGVDNGIFVWLNGAYLGGQMAPGGSSLGEFVVNLGDLSSGTHYLQILREDHGGAADYDVSVTGTPVPEPTTLALLGAGLVAVRARRRRSA